MNQGLSLGNNKLLIDKEGSLFISKTDDLTNQQTWDKLPSTKNSVLQNLIAGQPLTYEVTSDLNSYDTSNKRLISAYQNNSVLDMQTGLIAPAGFSKEFSPTAYNNVSSFDDNSGYMMLTKTSLKIPQAIIKLNLIALVETTYKDLDLWGLYGASPIANSNGTTSYDTIDKVNILRSIISSVSVDSLLKSSTGNSYLSIYDSKNNQYDTSQVSNNTNDYHLISLSTSNMNLNIDDDGFITANVHGSASDGSSRSELQLNYIRFNVDINISMKDTYVSRANLVSMLKEVDRPSITMGTGSSYNLSEGDLHIVYQGYSDPLYGVLISNYTSDVNKLDGINYDFTNDKEQEVDNSDGRYNDNLSQIIESNGTTSGDSMNDDYRIYFQEEN